METAKEILEKTINRNIPIDIEVYDGVIAAMEEYKNQSEDKPLLQWVACSERLPQLGEEVIVFCPNSRSMVTALIRYIRYEGCPDFFWNNRTGNDTHLQETVTHWMPLPNPPFEEVKQKIESL